MSVQKEISVCNYGIGNRHLCMDLHDIMMLINSSPDVEKVLQQVVLVSCKAISCESVHIAMRESERWVIRHAYNLPDQMVGHEFSDDELPLATLAMTKRRPVAIEDAFHDERGNAQLMQALGIRSILVLPVMDSGRVAAALSFGYHSAAVSFMAMEVEYAEKVATGVAVAFQHAGRFQLQQSERFKQGILDSLLPHLAVIDTAGTITAVNASWIRFAERNGLPDAHRVGTGLNYLAVCRKAADMSDPLAVTALEGIEAVLAGKRDTFTLEYPCNSPTEERWFLMNVVRPPHGFEGAVITHFDISDRKRMEEELRSSKERDEATTAQMEAIIGSMNDALIVADPDGNFTTLNPAALRLHGFLELQEARKNVKEYRECVRLYDLADRVLSPEDWPIARALRGEVFSNQEIRVQNEKTGREFIGNYSGTPVRDKEGNIILGLLSVRDVTERHKAEEALRISEANYRAIFDSANDAIFIHDADTGKVLDVNQKMLDMYKCSKEEAQGMTALAISGDPDVTEDDIRSIIWGVVTGGPRVFDWLGKDRAGRRFWVEVSLKKVILQGEDRVLAAVRDISDRKEAEEEVKRLNASLASHASELEAANRELEAFNYTVAHDLRKPLTIINGYSQAIREICGEQLSTECTAFLDEVYTGTVKMNQLIDALIRFSRLAHIEPRREKVNLSALAHEVVAELRRAEPERRIDFELEQNMTAEGDAELLRVVLANLIGNAWKFTSEKARGTIQFGISERDGRKIYFVRDNGAGFDMVNIATLFTPFRRLPGSDRTKGFGIGLATVERIIKRHGGDIWAEGAPGRGATFYFTLPNSHSSFAPRS